ncbi:MAG: hypothetical protein CSB44_09765 [Gammaproteobacteria bacterium]|nr:MAG: hypothetical protein CSB44_09765 [Gammaproteobacteria bacterium]PIE36358.1 MAG: hypothetical protein CSA54_04680 [Gammaproteobacteria bacterium]
MNRRWQILLPTLAALVSAAMLMVVLALSASTRNEVLSDGLLEFHYVQQVDHNLDAFSLALTNYRLQAERGDGNASPDEYIRRYDILYSGIQHLGPRWLGSLLDNASAYELQRDITRFVNETEPLMNDDDIPSGKTLTQLASDANALSERVHELGITLYHQRTQRADSIEDRIRLLTWMIVGFGASFMLFSALAMWMLWRSSNRAVALARDASETHDRLSRALQKVTSGDNERRAQTRFIAAASHDLRQPLHALGLNLNSLERHVSTEQGRNILTNVFRSTEALNELLGSLLDISRLDAGVIGVDRQVFPLLPLLVQLQENFEPDAEAKGLELHVADSELFLDTDRILFDRILGNLVGNAIKYTSEGSVSITATTKSLAGREVALIRICDTGRGIPESEQRAIFDEYYQLDNPERDRSKGLGLGLSIVSRLVRLLGIELELDSAPGKGTCFTLTVPRGSGETAAEVQAGNDLLPGFPQRDDQSLQKRNILIIDDEQDVRDGMCTMLESHGAHVITADSADTARERLVSEDLVPDVIVADYRLRDRQTGDRAIELIREEFNTEVPALIVTGDTSPERLREAKGSGHTLLHKPVVAEELVARIAALADGVQQ